MADVQKLAEEIANLTLLEASELKDTLEDMLGVEAASGGGMPMMMAGGMAGAPGAAAAEEEEEATEFDVVLTDVGGKKINVIKAVRALTSLGLKEAKDLVEGAPSTVLEAVTKEAAEEAVEKLEAEGAKSESKPA